MVPQAIDVSDPQAPLYNCISGFEKFAPWLLIEAVCVVFAATNLYQTSKCAVPDSHPVGKPVVEVEFTKVPAVFEQLVADVNVVAATQSSFDGGGV